MRERLPPAVLARLEEAGRLGDRMGVAIYAVGGFVRDLLMGIKNQDLDLAVEGDGITFARMLARRKAVGFKAYERFGTALLFFPGGVKVDVATARGESYRAPAALPTVTPGSIKDDLFRRDFTINALAVHLNRPSFGDLLDLYGGRRDLAARTIRVLHSRSFLDDPTRIFRAIRFEHRFGFALDRETLALLQHTSRMDLLGRLSGHRFLNEVVLLLSERRTRRAVARLGELGLLRFIHPRLAWSPQLAALLKTVEATLDLHQQLSAEEKIDRWLVYFMALMSRLSPRDVEEALTRFPVRARHARAIRTGHASADAILRRLARPPVPKPGEIHRLLRGLSDETLLLLMAGSKAASGRRRLLDYLGTYRHVRPSIGGADLKALGLEPGPRFTQILDRLLEARLNGEITTKAEERALAKKLVEA